MFCFVFYFEKQHNFSLKDCYARPLIVYFEVLNGVTLTDGFSSNFVYVHYVPLKIYQSHYCHFKKTAFA